MTNNEEQVRLGKDAALVLDNAAFQLAIKGMHEEITRAWKKCDVRDSEGQRLMLQMSKCAELFETHIIGLVERGKFAQNELNIEKARQPKSWVRKVIG